jgi:hypothetical protein
MYGKGIKTCPLIPLPFIPLPKILFPLPFVCVPDKKHKKHFRLGAGAAA